VEAQVPLANMGAVWIRSLRSREPSSGFNIAPASGDSKWATEGRRSLRFNYASASMSAAGRFMDEAPGIPREATHRRVLDGLAAAGFNDIRQAHCTVFQYMPPCGIRLRTLAGAALMTKQSMGYLVDELEGRGYVERAADPADRRARSCA
jgi:hypothetical protein